MKISHLTPLTSSLMYRRKKKRLVRKSEESCKETRVVDTLRFLEYMTRKRERWHKKRRRERNRETIIENDCLGTGASEEARKR